MTTIYKFKSFYTEEGIGATPSSAPVATVVDTDADSKLATEQATTSLANLIGYYEYEYSGADNLDLVCLFHTSDTGTDQQDLVSYVVEKVYQADAKLDVIDGIVDAILVDTGTDIPASITTVQADLDNPSQYKADVSALALEATLTAMKGAGWTTETLVSIKAVIDDILIDTGTTLDTKLNTIDGIVDDILVDTGTTGVELTANAVDAILDEIVVGTYTMRDLLKTIGAKMHGLATGGGTTEIKYTGLDGTANVIVETVDSNGNRSNVVLTV
jgi:hypothetical protein